MKKYLKVGAAAAAVLLIGVFVYMVDFFTGYPVSYFRVQHAAEQYLEEMYPDTGYVLSKPSYSLKLGGFQLEASVPDSIDNHFGIDFYHDGTLKYDTYEEDVRNRGNTAFRLSHDYKVRAQEVFENSDFPFAADFSGSFDDAITENKRLLEEPGTYPVKWDIKELVLDEEYNVAELSGQYGTGLLHVTSRDVSLRTAAESLLRLKEIMEESHLPFKSVDLWISSEKTDDSGKAIKQLKILNFGWDDIDEEGLEERVQAAAAATEAYRTGIQKR